MTASTTDTICQSVNLTYICEICGCLIEDLKLHLKNHSSLIADNSDNNLLFQQSNKDVKSELYKY